MLCLVTGSSGSGKSEWAEGKILEIAGEKKLYLATMRSFGAEGERRVKRHRALRAGKGFETIERAVDLTGIPPETLRGATVLLEDLSNLIANEMFDPEGVLAAVLAERSEGPVETGVKPPQEGGVSTQDSSSHVPERSTSDQDDVTAWLTSPEAGGLVFESVTKSLLHVAEYSRNLVIVANEIASDGQRYDPVTESFRRVTGKINCFAASMCGGVTEVVLGIGALYEKMD